jgi:DNA polymerase-1
VWRAQIDELKQGTFYRVFTEMDLPLVEILGQMELHGIRVDTSYLSKLSTDFGREMEGLSTRIQAFSKRGPLNLNSPKQLQDFLFHELGLPTQGKTKTGYSTDASVLEVLAQLHEAPKLLLEYRELSKLKGTYVDPLPQMLDRRTGRLHTHFLQTRTATGRLASVDPNLQNIPIRTERGMKIRRAFIAEEGWELLSADYSQIELRILAHMSQDPVLVESFRRGEDVHRRTGAEIFNVAPENLTDSQRGVAKAINFGLMYGKTPFGLSQELGISVGQAKEMIDRYFLRYAGVKAFLDRLIDSARKNGQTQTLFGRVRKLPEIHAKNPALRANAERMAMNTPIQGTAADLMKLGMIRIHAALQDHKLDARMLLQVHDEVIVEVKEGQRGRIEPLVRESLEEAMKLEVPLVSNLAWGANWSEL